MRAQFKGKVSLCSWWQQGEKLGSWEIWLNQTSFDVIVRFIAYRVHGRHHITRLGQHVSVE